MMTIEEIKARLDRYEWNGIEFKNARTAMSNDAGQSLVSLGSDQVNAPADNLVTQGRDQARPLTSQHLAASMNFKQKAPLRFCRRSRARRNDQAQDRVAPSLSFPQPTVSVIARRGTIQAAPPGKQAHPQQTCVVTEAAIDLLANLIE